MVQLKDANVPAYIKYLKRGVSWVFFIKVTGMGLAFLLQLLLAKLLKVDEYGLYIYVLTWLNLLLLIVTHGWDTAAIRFVSEYYSRSEWSLLKGFLITSRTMPIKSALMVSIVMIAIVSIASEKIGANTVILFFLGCLLLPVNTLLQVGCSSLQGVKKILLSQVPQQIFRPIAFVIIIVSGVFLFGLEKSAFNVLLMNILSALVALIFVTMAFRRAMPEEYFGAVAEYKKQEWLNIALPLLLVSGFIMLMNRLDILMLGAILGTDEAGIYSVSARVAELAAFSLTVVNSVMAPMIADLYSNNKKSELQKLASISVLVITVITTFIGLFLIVFGKNIIGMFGEGFSPGLEAMNILIVSQMINAMAGSVGFMMSMTGHQNIAAMILGFVAILNALLNYLLIPGFGMEGAAMATAISMVIWNVIMAIVVKNRTGISATILSVWRLVR